MKNCTKCNKKKPNRITALGLTICFDCLKGVKLNQLKTFLNGK